MSGIIPRRALRRARLSGYRVTCVPAVEAPLLTRLLPRPRASASAGRVVRENAYRITARLHWEQVGPVLVKVHGTRGGLARLTGLWKPSRAGSEWRAARFLAGVGLPVAEPLALAEHGGWHGAEPSVFVARFLDGVRTFREALAGQPPRLRRALHRRSARLVRAMHDAGFDHRDLHATNVLVGPGPGDVAPLVLADLHRSRVGRPVGDRARAASIARWMGSLPSALGPGHRFRWLLAYAGGERRVARRHYLRMGRAMARLERTRRASRGRRCLRESTVFTRDVGTGTRGVRARVLAVARIDEVLAAHDRAAACGQDSRLVKASHKSVVTRHGDVVVKESLSGGPLGGLRTRLAPDRHRRGYEGAHRLGVVGVLAAAPLAYLRRGGRVFTLFEDLSHLERLDHAARRVYAVGGAGARAKLRDASADWLARMHRRGVYHGDLKGVNVLVDRRGLRPRFHLIDTDRVRLGDRPVAMRRRVKNLAQLAGSIAMSVSRTERLRWWRRYAQGMRLDRAAERRYARAVAAMLARRTLVVDEPLE